MSPNSKAKVGRICEITAVDDFSKEPHALEVTEEGRFIMAVLWRPESSHMDETGQVLDLGSVKLMKLFVSKCQEYKDQKIKML